MGAPQYRKAAKTESIEPVTQRRTIALLVSRLCQVPPPRAFTIAQPFSKEMFSRVRAHQWLCPHWTAPYTSFSSGPNGCESLLDLSRQAAHVHASPQNSSIRQAWPSRRIHDYVCYYRKWTSHNLDTDQAYHAFAKSILDGAG